MTDKTKVTTIQQRFGFRDDELKTARHDEIMIWLDSNAHNIVQEFVFDRVFRDVSRVNELLGTNYDARDIDPDYQIVNKIWEYSIMDKSFCIGFIDMRMSIRYQTLVAYTDSGYGIDGIKHKTVVAADRETTDLYFEVKTKLDSIGEVIRQINLYRSYIHNGRFIIVCPDNRFESVFASQGISLITYNGVNRSGASPNS